MMIIKTGACVEVPSHLTGTFPNTFPAIPSYKPIEGVQEK